MSSIPIVPNSDRISTATLSASKGPIAIDFPIFGGADDLSVLIDGMPIDPADWTLTSISGNNPATDILPSGDGRVTFASLRTGDVEVVGTIVPRRTAQFPTGVGIKADGFNMEFSRQAAFNQEVKRDLGETRENSADIIIANGRIQSLEFYDTVLAGRLAAVESAQANGGPNYKYLVANIAARDALAGVQVGDRVAVADAGDGQTKIYELLTLDPKTWSAPLVFGTTALQSTALTVTVGPGGTYATINAAIEAVSRLKVLFKNSGVLVRISLRSGFVMAEQVLVREIDLSWIRITSVDAEVTIARSTLTTAFGESGNYPAFGASFGGKLPAIGCLFNMDASGTGTNRHGVFLYKHARGVVLEGCGVKSAGGHGALLWQDCALLAHSSVFSGAGIDGFHVTRKSQVDAADCDVSGAARDGMFVYRSSVIEAHSAPRIQNCGRYAVYAFVSGFANVTSGNLSGAGALGILAEFGCHIVADGANISNVGTTTSHHAVAIQHGSFLEAIGANLSNAAGAAAVITNGSRAILRTADCSGAGGAWGVYASEGSLIVISDGNAQRGGSPNTNDMVVQRGSTIVAINTIGGRYQSENITTIHGTIFAVSTGSFSVADDAVAVIPINATAVEMFIINCTSGTKLNTPSGIFRARTSSPVFVEPTVLDVSSNVAVQESGGVLTGTTGDDGKVTISVHTNGNLYIENRSGGALSFRLERVRGGGGVLG